MALSLASMLQMANTPLVQKVIYTQAKYNSILSIMEMEATDTLTTRKAIYDGVNSPDVSWLNLGEDPVVTDGKFETVEGSFFMARNMIKLDMIYSAMKDFIGNPKDEQVNMYLKALSRNLTNMFINNDNVAGYTKCFDGLRGRMNKRSVYGIPSELRKDMSGLDLRPANITGSNVQYLLRVLDDTLAILNVNNDTSKIKIICNETLKNALAHGLRLSGAGAGFKMTEDAFGRQIPTYAGVEIYDPGFTYPYRDTVTRILPNSETATGLTATGGDRTSLFIVRFDEDGLLGLLPFSMDRIANDIGRFVDGVIDRIVMNFGFGLLQTSAYSVAQLYNLKVQ